MGSLSTFQLVVIALCVVFLLLGVGIFAAFGGLLGGSPAGPVTIWGTLDSQVLNDIVTTLRTSDKTFANVKYVQKDPTTYQNELLNAMAAGTGPDLFLIPQESLISFSNKITPIPYSAVSQSQFVGSFIDEGSLFLTPQGALALPFTIDPLVMYWNRDLFANAGLPRAPQYWNELLTIAPKISSLQRPGASVVSAVALGEWSNINNAKPIISSLFLQAGDAIISRDSAGNPTDLFGSTPPGAAQNPAESVIIFYTDFANPSKTTYSWNASLPNSVDAFNSGNLAMYFGFAGEYQSLISRNPNLHFSVAALPQLQGNTPHLTFGEMTGIALSRTAANPQGAVQVAEKLTSQQVISQLAQALQLPPVRRDVIIDTSNNAPMQVFVQSSLLARGWLDPDPTESNTIFKNMIQQTVSGAEAPAGAVSEASQALGALLPNAQ